MISKTTKPKFITILIISLLLVGMAMFWQISNTGNEVAPALSPSILS